MIIFVIAILTLNIDFKQENPKIETLEFQRFDEPKFESNLTFIHINDGKVSGEVSTEIPQTQLDYSVNVQEVSRGNSKRIPMELPSQTSGEFKTYMDYRCITDTSSNQYKLQQQAYTDDKGFRRVKEDYCVALGTHYTQSIGDRFHIKLDSGLEFTAIVSDIKMDKHTDSSNRYIKHNGNIVEFVIDKNKMDDLAIKMGDVSYAGLEGGIVSIERMIE